MPFEFRELRIDGAVLIEPDVFTDERGFLLETYDADSFAEAGLSTDFVLEFYSKSQRDVLRGLHQQAHPYQQAKIVRAFRGEVFDVVVDVRPESDTYGECVSRVLSAENKHALFVPSGCLHGFVTISNEATVHYKVDNEYAPDHERGVIWDDPDLDIDWPVEDPIVSDKDRSWPTLRESAYWRD